MEVNGVSSVSGDEYGPISLDVGPNTITVNATAEDGTTVSEYTIIVTRAPSATAALGSLTLSSATLNEPFASGTTAYTANVANNVTEISVTPTVSLSTASLKVNGVATVSGSVYGPIALAIGANVITIAVTAQDGVTTSSYSIVVTRAPASTVPLPEQSSGGSGIVTPPVILNDISGHWAEAEIRKAVAEGWVTGYPDGSFKPNGEVTRAEFVQMLARSQGWKMLESMNIPVFTDINDIGLWARPTISMAVQKGIINGYEDGSFLPNQPMMRAEMTMMIIRALGITVESDGYTSFADNAKIPAWSRPYIAEAAKRGLVKGGDNNRFEPNRTSTRAEAVVILTRLLNKN